VGIDSTRLHHCPPIGEDTEWRDEDAYEYERASSLSLHELAKLFELLGIKVDEVGIIDVVVVAGRCKRNRPIFVYRDFDVLVLLEFRVVSFYRNLFDFGVRVWRKRILSDDRR
jgi:hypothetical protein